jgi:hypothetical protein
LKETPQNIEKQVFLRARKCFIQRNAIEKGQYMQMFNLQCFTLVQNEESEQWRKVDGLKGVNVSPRSSGFWIEISKEISGFGQNKHNKE